MPGGIRELIANSIAMKRQRAQEKEQENLLGVAQSLAAITSPSIQRDMANGMQDLDYYLGEIVGPGYKEHQPFVQSALHGLGNAVLGSMGLQLPQKRQPQIPVQGGGQGAPGGQPAPQLLRRDGTPVNQPPPQGPGVNYTPANRSPVATGVAPSVLAGAAPSVSPASLATGRGVPVGKQPGAPVLMPISPEAKREGTLAYLSGQGKFGKSPQETQEYLSSLQQSVIRGDMTAAEAKENAKNYLTSQAQSTGATGTERDIYVQFPATGTQPAHTEMFQFNSRTQGLSQFGKPVPWETVAQRGGKQVTKPAADKTAFSNVSGRNKAVQDFYAQHPELGPPPKPTDIVRITQRTSGETGQPEIVSALLMPEPAGAGRTQLAQLQKAAADRFGRIGPDGKPQKLSQDEANQIGSDMYINYTNLRTMREQQQMGVTEFTTSIPPGLGIESLSLPPGVVRLAGAAPLSVEQVDAMGTEAPAAATPQGPPVQAAPPPAGAPAQAPAAAPAGRGATFSPAGVPTAPAADQERNSINEYLAKINGLGGYNQAGAMQGALTLQRQFNLTPGQLDEAAAEYVGNKNALKNNQEQSAGMLRFVEANDQFAEQFLQAAARVPDAGSLLGNAVQRDVMSKFYSNPKLARMRGALMALDRTWAAIVSNAYQSKAQLPQGAQNATALTLNHDMPFSEMVAMAQQIKRESATERYTFEKQQWDIKKKQAENPIGQATGVTAGPEPKKPAALQERPQNGQRAKGPGGQWYVYDAVKDRWYPEKKKK